MGLFFVKNSYIKKVFWLLYFFINKKKKENHKSTNIFYHVIVIVHVLWLTDIIHIIYRVSL